MAVYTVLYEICQRPVLNTQLLLDELTVWKLLMQCCMVKAFEVGMTVGH